MITACNINNLQCNLSNFFLSVSDYSGTTNPLYDLNNALIAVLITTYLSLKYKIPKIFLIILILHIFIPFFLNGFLFTPEYMPDQFRYWNAVIQFRSLNFNFEESITVYTAGLLLSLVPIPFIFSLISIGIMNKLTFCMIFIYLYKNKFLNRTSAWFYLLYPSLALYSGLALRDTLILFFMIISTSMLLRRFYFKAFLLASPLLILKFPIAPILFIAFIGYLFCLSDSNTFNRKNFLFYLLSIFFIYIFIAPLLLDQINLYRLAMYYEDVGMIDGYDSINNIVSLTQKIIESLYTGFFSPSPLSSSGFQFIQSLENIFIFIFIFAVLYIKSDNQSIGRLVFWTLSFIMIVSIYSLVVFNLGTFSRYKFPMIAWFFLVIMYEYQRTNKDELT